MKIPLVIRNRYGRPAPFARVAINGFPMGFIALVDTGSPWTVITPMGIEMLKIRRWKRGTSKLAKKTPQVTFAGYEFKRYITEFKICIKDEKNKIVTFDKPSPTLLKPVKNVDPKEFKEVPIIIGCDFLMENKLSLYFNTKDKIAFFE